MDTENYLREFKSVRSRRSRSERDTVLVRQRRRNKFSTCTPFKPKPYIVEGVNGTMITAKRTTDQRRITRNSSHYKKVKTTEYVHTEPSDDQVPWNFEAGIGYLPESEQRVEEESVNPVPTNLDQKINHQLCKEVDGLEDNQCGQKTTSCIRISILRMKNVIDIVYWKLYLTSLD